ncbi:MAG: hypothetical protein ACKOPI_06900 [bacterium]
MSLGQARSSVGVNTGQGSDQAWWEGDGAPALALAALSVVASVWFLLLTSGEYFFSDEWSRFSLYPNVGFTWSLHGANGHLVFLNVLLYRALLEVFGGGSYLPFRLVCLLLQLAAVWLLFSYLRPRVNAWLVVGCISPLLFLGSAWVVTASAYGSLILTPIVLGLAALLALDRQSRSSDLLASGLLLLAVLAHSGGLPFLVGAAVLLAHGSDRSRSRLWVIAPASIAYLAWFAWTRWLSPGIDFFGEPLSVYNLGFLPRSLIETPSAALAAATGTFYRLDPAGALDFNLAPGYVLLLLSVIGLVALWSRRREALSIRVLMPVSMLVLFTVLISFGMSDPARQPTSPRYLYFTTLCVIWTFCEVSPAIRWRPWKVGVLVGVICLGLLANASIYGKAANALRDAGVRSRAALTAIAAAGPIATPTDRLSDLASPGVEDGAYSEWIVALDQRSIRRFGGDTLTLGALAEAGPKVRSIVDRVLFAVERIELAEMNRLTDEVTCEAPSRTVRVDSRSPIEVLPGDSLAIAADVRNTKPIEVTVGRYAGPELALDKLGAGEEGQIDFPQDGSKQPWQVAFSSGGRARVCLATQPG